MTEKPNKKARAEFPPKPTTEEILTARLAAGDTQEQAGERIYVRERTWQDYERGEREMPRGLYEFYLIRTDPKFAIKFTGQRKSRKKVANGR